MRTRLIVGAAVAVVVTLAVASAGLTATGTSHVRRTPTITGMIGGDFDTQLPAGSVNGADWGVDGSFQRPANNRIHDGDVKVVGGGDATDSFECTGSASHPSAPQGKVCIYLI